LIILIILATHLLKSLGTGRSEVQGDTENERHCYRRHEYTKERENVKEHNIKN
jgi:hypothetical protein